MIESYKQKSILKKSERLKYVFLIFILSISGFFTSSAQDTTPPEIASTVPANGSVGVTPTSTYLISFNEPVSKVNLRAIRLMRIGKPDVEVAVMNSLNITTDSKGNFVIDFTSGTIENGEQYYLEIPNTVFKDANENFFAGTDESNWLFTTNYLPTNITFDNETIIENIAVGSSAGGFSATDQDVGQTYTYSLVNGAGDDDNVDFSIVNNELIVNEAIDYETKDEYRIRVAVADNAGGQYEKAIRIEVENVDDTPPVLVSSNPANNETGVDVSTDVILTFDEDVFFSDNTVVTLYLDRGTSGAVQSWQVVNGTLPSFMSVDENEITLEVVNDLWLGQDYSVRGFQIQDELGNEGFTSPFTFTTRSVFTETDILSFTAPGMIGTADIDDVNHTITATMSANAPIDVVPDFVLSPGAALFGSLPDQWATNELYWESGETKTVNIRSESAVVQTWSVSLIWQPLAGTYSVGETGYFRLLSSALNELEVRGIGADVTFELMDGFDEEGNIFLDLDPYPGNDAHTTTITMEDGATTAHIFYFQFGMDGIQNFVIDGKGVLEAESVTNNFFDLDPDAGGNPCRNITLKNLIGFRDENSTATAFGGFVNADAVENLIVENNTLSYQGATVIRVVGSNSDVEVSGNTIRATDTGLLTAVVTTATGNITVVNNTISVSAQRGAGLNVLNGDNVQISHNTIYTDFTISNQANAGIQLGTSTSTPQVSNNIIQMNGPVRQAGLYISDTEESEVNLSYNNIYLPFDNPSENYVQFLVGAITYGVNQWESFLENHPNNTNTEVFFTDANQGDLTLSGSSLAAGALRGIPINSVPLDIDGVLRSNLGPSKGAYEYDNIATDMLSFSLTDQESAAIIDFENHTIEALLEGGASFTQVATVVPNTGATVSPASGASQDFSIPVVYTVTAEAGNTQEWTVTVTENDDIPPAVVTYSPTTGSSDVSVATNLALTFDEPIQFSSAANPISIRYLNGTQFVNVPLNDETYAQIAGNTLTIMPGIDLPGTSELYIIFPSGAIEDLNGNPFLGFSDSGIWNFTTGVGTITWDGTAWSNGAGPATDGSDNVIIDASGVYSFSSQGSFSANDLTIVSGTAVTVDNGGTLVVNGDVQNSGGLLVLSGSSFINFEGTSFTGNAFRIRRNTRYADGKYSFVGTPVENVNMTGEDLGEYVFKYNEATPYGTNDGLDRWEDASADVLISGKGYTQANQQMIEFVGKPNTGTITYTGSYENDGWHLVSNPYAAAIFIDDFLDANTNTTDAIYIWDDNGSDTGRGSNNDYIVANKTAATDISGSDNASRWNEHIGSAQGFFVKLDGSPGNITFTEAMRVSGNNSDNNFFRALENKTPILRLNLTHADGLIREAIIGWNESVSNTEISEGYDAPVFNTDADYAIYTEKAGQYLTIQTITSEREDVAVGFNIAEAGHYSIEFKLEHLSEIFYLHDQVTDEFINVSNGPYNFYSEAAKFNDRFVLTKRSNVLALEDQLLNIYAFDKVLHIETTGSQPAQYQVFNLSGVSVMNINASGSTTLNLSHLTDGIYIVSDGIKSKKIILK